ncbi:PAS domain-containing sensor histidine kinase [bacterium]|nr:PAS domain-containing sensor histidine kinase [bacterium]
MKKLSPDLELEERHRILLENIGEGLCGANRNMVITFVNDKLCEITGYGRNELLGKGISSFVENESKEILMSQLRKRIKGCASRYTLKFRRKGGEEISLSISAVPLFDERGKFNGSITILSDITERKKLEEELKERTRELEKEIEKRSQLLVNLYRGVAVTEERNRLAQEIHDGLAQTLATSFLKIELCKRLLGDNPEEVKKELCELRKMLAKSIKATRQVVFGLRLPNFHRTGFDTVLKQYFQEFRRKAGVTGNLNLKLERSLPVRTQVGIYRIIREATSNVRKHAMAKHVDIRLRTDKNGNLHLIIEDDGKGFDLEEALARNKYAKHFGLNGMEEQAKLLGGTFKIESAKGQGTRINVKVPLRE